jgi:hypothetical protein
VKVAHIKLSDGQSVKEPKELRKRITWEIDGAAMIDGLSERSSVIVQYVQVMIVVFCRRVGGKAEVATRDVGDVGYWIRLRSRPDTQSAKAGESHVMLVF